MRILPVLLACLLAGCSASPPPRYYSLGGSPAAGNSTEAAAMLVDILPVTLPERVDRAGLVLIGTDGSLDIRSDDRWAAPLSDEIRQVLADALWRQARAVDVYDAPTQSTLPHYRLALRIERFDAIGGQQAIVEAAWTIRLLPSGDSETCRAAASAAQNGATPAAAAAALGQAARSLAGQIADSLDGARSGKGCGASPQ